MIATYTITISRTTAVSQCTSAYKIFFIILELIKQFISSPPFYPLKNCRYRLYDDIGVLLSVSPHSFSYLRLFTPSVYPDRGFSSAKPTEPGYWEMP